MPTHTRPHPARIGRRTTHTTQGRFGRPGHPAHSGRPHRPGRRKHQQSMTQKAMATLKGTFSRSTPSKKARGGGRRRRAGGMALLAGGLGLAMKNRSKLGGMIGRRGSSGQTPTPQG